MVFGYPQVIVFCCGDAKEFLQFLLFTVNKTLRSVHFGVVVVELINCKCGGIVRNEIW